MKSIEPAVISTNPQAAGTKARVQEQQYPNKPDAKTVNPASAAAVAIQTDSAAGGQK